MKKSRMTIWAMAVVLATTSVGLADLMDGLVAYYPFNGNANDESDDNHGTPIGATLTVDRFGKPDRAYCFDGSSYIDCGNGSINIAGDLTLTTWVKLDDPDAISSEEALVGKFGPSHGPLEDNQYLLNLQPGPSIQFRAYQQHGYPGGEVLWEPDEWLIGRWVHIVATYDSATDEGVIYFNGLYGQAETMNGRPFDPVEYTTSVNLTLGATAYDGPEAHLKRYFVGCLDEVRIYNRALSSDDVWELYSTEVVPAPGALLLSSIGLAFSSWKLHRCRTL